MCTYFNNNSIVAPPLINNPHWDLNDGGQWKSENKYPVYTIPGFYGAAIMKQLALYSGNITIVPNSNLLSKLYDSHDYVRLYVNVNTGKAPVIPNVWAFLLIVLGMLLGVILLMSLLMHYIQRSRRQELRRLIAEGEVDLEALGIKRVKVLQRVLDKLPLFVYVDKQTIQNSALTTNTLPESNEKTSEVSNTGAKLMDSISSTPGYEPKLNPILY